jgi:hypothetical protein
LFFIQGCRLHARDAGHPVDGVVSPSQAGPAPPPLPPGYHRQRQPLDPGLRHGGDDPDFRRRFAPDLVEKNYRRPGGVV